MRLFHCSHCGYVVFFDSVQCVHCGHTLAFSPQAMDMLALVPAEDGTEGVWQQSTPEPEGDAATAPPPPADPAGAPPPRYRMCHNRTAYQACNFAVPDDGSGEDGLCASCQQTRVLPDLSNPDNLRRWTQIEVAKRRLYYSLARLGLEAIEGEAGPVFEFLEDLPGEPPVMTGHANGLITLNVAEADDDERARRRVALGEPYRTLLGHLRHESGHYFWEVLVLRGGQAEAFRAMFGDERQDYGEALKAHYAKPPSNDWQEAFVSAYAASHPWEDWAETWAHYMHMVDLLETAQSYQTEVTVPGPHDAPRYAMVNPFADPVPDFDSMLASWVPLTLLLNSLTRSLGQLDAYPFALTAPAQEKLRFVHELMRNAHLPRPAPQEQADPAPAAARAVAGTPPPPSAITDTQVEGAAEADAALLPDQ